MSHSSDPRVLALHGLRLKGVATADVVAEVVGLDIDTSNQQLTALVDEGFAQYREGRISGFSFTPAGRREHERLLAAELDSTGTRTTVDRCYRRFLELNEELLALCTAWQGTVGGGSVTNDHTDAAYDDGTIHRLAQLDGRVQPICRELGAALDRMAQYGPRLREARERVQAGDREYFTAPMIASYHTVWFELHEDLLATLGIARSS